MLKLTYCLTRRERLTREAFQTYWRETHAPLVEAARDALAIRRYVQVHTVSTALSGALDAARPGLPIDDYDGVAELWWDDEESLIAAMQSEAGRHHGTILATDEAEFIDFSRSQLFWGREREIAAA
ncbi:MAG: EthD domain-containing protein [Pseudomonadota bacterium]